MPISQSLKDYCQWHDTRHSRNSRTCACGAKAMWSIDLCDLCASNNDIEIEIKIVEGYLKSDYVFWGSILNK